MSSYSSSVKALIYGRRHSVRKSAEPEHALLVAMQDTPGLSNLPFATKEVAILNDLCPSLQLNPIRPPMRKEDVLAHLRTCKIFHFAGHGKSDPSEPSRSCLLLQDWKDNPLTVGDLHEYRLQENSPFLGYLSACSTGINKADTLIDEGIHLVSACQLAGFRHVVGTLWNVSDEHCADVAKVFYETIRDEGMTDVALCRGLHRATRALRDGRIEMGRVTGESGITTAHRNGTEAAEVGDNKIETMQEDGNWLKAASEDGLKDTTKAEGGAPATATQTDGRLTCEKEGIEVMNNMDKENAKAGDKNCRRAWDGNEDDRTREGRDIIPEDDEKDEIGQESHKAGQEDPRYWAPYIHFGV